MLNGIEFQTFVTAMQKAQELKESLYIEH